MQKGIKEGLLRDAILGTTAERLVARCECPILVEFRSERRTPTAFCSAIALSSREQSSRLA